MHLPRSALPHRSLTRRSGLRAAAALLIVGSLAAASVPKPQRTRLPCPAGAVEGTIAGNSGSCIIGRVVSLLDDTPIASAEVTILRHIVEVLQDGSYLIHPLDAAAPLGITARTDINGCFAVTVPLGPPPNYVAVVIRAAGYHKIEHILTPVATGVPTEMSVELTPTRLTPTQLKTVQKKLELRKPEMLLPEQGAH